jgi:hypothetical protein
MILLKTVNGNSNVQSYDVYNMNLQGGDADSIEFIATFPGTVVTTGDQYNAFLQYNACVLILKRMDKYCEEGHNSPSKRPEFVDITVGEAKKSDTLEEEKKSKVKVNNDVLLS